MYQGREMDPLMALISILGSHCINLNLARHDNDEEALAVRPSHKV